MCILFVFCSFLLCGVSYFPPNYSSPFREAAESAIRTGDKLNTPSYSKDTPGRGTVCRWAVPFSGPCSLPTLFRISQACMFLFTRQECFLMLLPRSSYVAYTSFHIFRKNLGHFFLAICSLTPGAICTYLCTYMHRREHPTGAGPSQGFLCHGKK